MLHSKCFIYYIARVDIVYISANIFFQCFVQKCTLFKNVSYGRTV